MNSREIAAALERTERLLKGRPSAGLQSDAACHARWLGGMRVAASDPQGREVVTDLPAVLGGAGEAVTPGWLVRAGLANCTASCIVFAAARAQIELDLLEVDVTSRSDARGVFGLTESDGAPVSPGPRDLEMTVRIAAHAASPDRLRALVDAACAVSPVQTVIERASPVAVRVEIG
jgi:uncharacterized OsmC-like protein